MSRAGVIVVVLLAMLASGCSVHVRPGSENLAQVDRAGSATSNAPKHTGTVVTLGEQFDPAAEEAVANGCLVAWRAALSGDEAKAMGKLEELKRKYPKVTTVRFMMGQCLEKLGKKQEAIKYYQEALELSGYNSMYTFKLAESLRTTGDAKAAVTHYRHLLNKHPEFVPARLGLAQALYALDKDSDEALKLTEQVLESEPGNKEASKLLANLKKAQR